MKTTINLIFLAAFLYGCGAIVAEQPTQPEVLVIPSSPGQGYIWINDSWLWDRQLRVYQLQRGYWTAPKRKTTIWVDGHWKQTRTGWKYVKGHWR